MTNCSDVSSEKRLGTISGINFRAKSVLHQRYNAEIEQFAKSAKFRAEKIGAFSR